MFLPCDLHLYLLNSFIWRFKNESLIFSVWQIEGEQKALHIHAEAKETQVREL